MLKVGDLVKLKNLSHSARDYLKVARGIVIKKNFRHGFPAIVTVSVHWVDGIMTHNVPAKSLEVISKCK
mgnify:FL=1